jgi:hypothetical protein
MPQLQDLQEEEQARLAASFTLQCQGCGVCSEVREEQDGSCDKRRL